MASRLRSIPSAPGSPGLFGDFLATMRLSDFPRPFITGLRPWAFRCGPRQPKAAAGRGISRFPRKVCTRMHGVSDRAGSGCHSRYRGTRYCLTGLITPCAPEKLFHGSIPSLHAPLSTLHPHPHKCQCMTRGSSGSLLLSRYETFTRYTSPVSRRTLRLSNHPADSAEYVTWRRLARENCKTVCWHKLSHYQTFDTKRRARYGEGRAKFQSFSLVATRLVIVQPVETEIMTVEFTFDVPISKDPIRIIAGGGLEDD